MNCPVNHVALKCKEEECAWWVKTKERPDPTEFINGTCAMVLLVKQVGTLARYAYQLKRVMELQNIKNLEELYESNKQGVNKKEERIGEES